MATNSYSSARRDSTTDDSEFDEILAPTAVVVVEDPSLRSSRKSGTFFSDDGLCSVTESDDDVKNMRYLIDQKVISWVSFSSQHAAFYYAWLFLFLT